jgi:phage anti-repressor protein
MNDVSDAFAIKVRKIGDKEVLAVDARQLHEFLEVGRDFSTWMRTKLKKTRFAEGRDFSPVWVKNGRGRPSIEYVISVDMAKHLALMENTDRGEAVRDYFIDRETQLRDMLAREAVAKVLLLPSPREWEKRFNGAYYQSLARLTGLSYTGHSAGTPLLFGKITDDWVYQMVLPGDLLEDMRERRENSQKLHQWLTDGGLQMLELQILRVMDLADSSSGYPDFKARCMRVFKKPGQLGLIYPTAA